MEHLSVPQLLDELALAAAIAFRYLELRDTPRYLEAIELQARLQLELDSRIILEV
jgi:hypothetical protein